MLFQNPYLALANRRLRTPGRLEIVAASRHIDPPHSVAEFKVKYMMISSVKGRFSKLSGAFVSS
jgi:polyisoprenoid-binding protein YceI